jgi:UDP:flavonoid glycosyltransferase YjiC (YdhE family)
MRILITSTPGLGHFNPLLPLMRAALAEGDDVLVGIAESGAAHPHQHGFATTPLDDVDPLQAQVFWDGLAGQAEPNSYVISQFFGRLRTRAALASTVGAIEKFRPDLVVSELTEFAGQIAAEMTGVPHVTVGVAALSASDWSHAPLVAEIDEIRVDAGLDPVAEVPWRYGTRFVTALPRMLFTAPDEELPTGSLLVRHEDPEGHAADASQPVGPGIRQPARKGMRPRLYASLGSVAGRMPFTVPAYRNVLAGLAGCDADVLFTVGELDRSELGPIPANVHIESYVPQRVAMACDAVLTHGGAGTTVATLSRGLPMVVVPLFGDQPHNAARVQSAGAGVSVDWTEAPAALPSAVRSVIHDPSYAEVSRSIAAEMAARPTAAEALAELRSAPVY